VLIASGNSCSPTSVQMKAQEVMQSKQRGTVR
jgi:hypothetical protein